MSSGVAWIDKKVAALRGARAHLEGLGMGPTPVGGAGRYAIITGWRVPYWVGVFSDDQLLTLARDRGFRG
jgi:hypothetical protein